MRPPIDVPEGGTPASSAEWSHGKWISGPASFKRRGMLRSFAARAGTPALQTEFVLGRSFFGEAGVPTNLQVRRGLHHDISTAPQLHSSQTAGEQAAQQLAQSGHAAHTTDLKEPIQWKQCPSGQ